MQRREAIKKTALFAGSTAMVPSLLSLLQSCQKQPRLNWQPAYLSVEHAELVSSLADTLLPKTDTPGALDIKVDMFIDLVFGKLNDESGQKSMMAGMDAFEAKCVDKFGKKFSELNATDKVVILKEEEAGSAKYNGKVWGTAVGVQKPVGFYRSFKSLALWGYFSSEEIGKNVLSYDPVPGEYSGCIPLSDVGNSWSL